MYWINISEDIVIRDIGQTNGHNFGKYTPGIHYCHVPKPTEQPYNPGSGLPWPYWQIQVSLEFVLAQLLIIKISPVFTIACRER